MAAETPVVTIFGKSWLLHVTEVLGATPAQNLDMIADSVGFIVGPRPRGGLRRRALLRRLQGGPRLRARDPARRPRRRRPDPRPVRHERRDPDRRARPDPGRRPRARSRPTRAPPRSSGASTPTTTPSWRSRTRSPPCRPASATSRPRSTATASAAATPTWSRSWPTWRSRRSSVLTPPGGGDLVALTELSQVRRGDRQPEPQRLPALRRPVRVRPQGRRPRRRGGQGGAQLPARGPDGRRQRRAPGRVASWAARPTPRSGRASWATSSTACWTPRS